MREELYYLNQFMEYNKLVQWLTRSSLLHIWRVTFNLDLCSLIMRLLGVSVLQSSNFWNGALKNRQWEITKLYLVSVFHARGIELLKPVFGRHCAVIDEVMTFTYMEINIWFGSSKFNNAFVIRYPSLTVRLCAKDFCVVPAKLWNNLPVHFRISDSLSIFKDRVKTYKSSRN